MASDVRNDRNLTGTVPATPSVAPAGSVGSTVEARSPARPTPKQPTPLVDGQREAPRPVAPNALANVAPALEGPRDPVAAARTAAVGRATQLVQSYRALSTLALDGLLAQPVADWNLLELGDGRVRRDDAMHAVLRLNTAVWTVHRDLQQGRLAPKDFGRGDWQQVSGDDVYRLAMHRLQHGDQDWNAETKAMLADPKTPPLEVHHPERGKIRLTPDAISLMNRSPDAALMPNRAAGILEKMAVGQAMRRGATALAATGTDALSLASTQARAVIDVAATLFHGSKGGPDQRPLPPNASQTFAALAMATQTAYAFKPMSPAMLKGFLARSDLAERQELVKLLPGPDGQLVPHLGEPITDGKVLAREIQRKLKSGELNHLDETTRRAVAELAGPANDPGAAVLGRLDAEEANRKLREFTGTLVQAVALTPVTMGAGAGAAFGLRAAGASVGLSRGAYVVAQSASFTSMQQYGAGHFDWRQYPMDLVMFGALSRTGKLAGDLAAKYKMGPVASQLTAMGVTVSTGAVAGTGVGATFELLDTGKLPGGKRLLEQFGQNLAIGVVLHGVNVQLMRMRPVLGQNGVALAEHHALVKKTVTQQAALDRVTSEIEVVRAEGDRLAARGLGPESPERVANAEKAAGLLRQFEQVTAEVDALRGAMLAFAAKYVPEQAEAVRREFGEVNPEMVAVHAQTKAAAKAAKAATKSDSGDAKPQKTTSPRDAALFEYLSRFKSFRGMDVPQEALAPGVRGVSQNVLRAGSELIRGRFASADAAGAPNVEHVGSVLRDALVTRARELGRPLTQKEVDLEFERTWATDGRGKHPSFDAIKDAPTVWGGKTVGEVSAEMRANVRAAIAHDMEQQGVAPAVRGEVLRRFDEGKALGPPDSPPELAADVARVTDQVVKVHARPLATNPFLAFVWFHGALAPEQVVQMARSAGGDLGRVSDLLEGYYGHHVSHFPSMGLAAGGLKAPDFHELVGRGLSPEAASRLNAQWQASLDFYGKWSPRFMSDMVARTRGFSEADWATMLHDAAPLRRALGDLTPEVRRQLISDDVGQFTHDGMPKWTATTMNPPPGVPKPTTQAELAASLAGGPITGYLWSNLARSFGSVAELRAAVAQGTHPFVAQVQSMARATGHVIDAKTLAMRALRPGDPAYTERAWAIVNDAPLRKAFADAKGDAGKSPAQLLQAHGPEAVIRWFDAQAADPVAVNRLAASRLPPLPEAMGRTIPWRAVRDSMLDGTASRQVILDHKEGRFARSAAQGLREREAAGVPFAEAQRWYEQNWSRAVQRWNAGYGGRHGLEVDAHKPPPGLEPGQPRPSSYADLIRAAESRAFTVHTAVDEAGGARMVGSEGGSAVARVEVGRGTAATPEARAQQVMRNLVHEIDGHWKDGFFDYRPMRSVDDAMVNLRGEAYARLRELFEFEPDRALAIVDSKAELRAFLEATAKEFAASPHHRAYFGAPGDAMMQQAVDRLARQGERFIAPERGRGVAPSRQAWVTNPGERVAWPEEHPVWSNPTEAASDFAGGAGWKKATGGGAKGIEATFDGPAWNRFLELSATKDGAANAIDLAIALGAKRGALDRPLTVSEVEAAFAPYGGAGAAREQGIALRKLIPAGDRSPERAALNSALEGLFAQAEKNALGPNGAASARQLVEAVQALEQGGAHLAALTLARRGSAAAEQGATPVERAANVANLARAGQLLAADPAVRGLNEASAKTRLDALAEMGPTAAYAKAVLEDAEMQRLTDPRRPGAKGDLMQHVLGMAPPDKTPDVLATARKAAARLRVVELLGGSPAEAAKLSPAELSRHVLDRIIPGASQGDALRVAFNKLTPGQLVELASQPALRERLAAVVARRNELLANGALDASAVWADRRAQDGIGFLLGRTGAQARAADGEFTRVLERELRMYEWVLDRALGNVPTNRQVDAVRRVEAAASSLEAEARVEVAKLAGEPKKMVEALRTLYGPDGILAREPSVEFLRGLVADLAQRERQALPLPTDRLAAELHGWLASYRGFPTAEVLAALPR